MTTTAPAAGGPNPQVPDTAGADLAAESAARARGGTESEAALRALRSVQRDDGDKLTIAADGRLAEPTRDERPTPASPASGVATPRLVTDLPMAIDTAARRLETFITNRSAALTYPMIMVPFDGTRRYRLGDMGTDGYGMNAETLAARRQLLVDRGFPAYDESEATFINAINYTARARTGRAITLQHFPGGGPELETTEDVAVHYSDAAQVRGYVENYARAIRMRPPEGIMLSHASYTRDGFPGIAAIDDHRDSRPGFLRDIPFDKLPASLNPSLVRYLRDNVGHRGLVVPDWYDMGAIEVFIRDNIRMNLGPPLPAGSGDAMIRGEVCQFVLALEAGVDQIPAMHPDMATDPGWQALERNHPDEYRETLRRLDERVRDTYARLAPAGSPPLDTARFSFEEKVLLLIYNPNAAPTYESAYRSAIATDADPAKRDVFQLFMSRGLGDYDVWNRTGVLTLMFRQNVVEAMTGRQFPQLVSTTAAQRDQREVQWFAELMANREFRGVYDRIPWDSPELHRLYDETLARRFPPAA